MPRKKAIPKAKYGHVKPSKQGAENAKGSVSIRKKAHAGFKSVRGMRDILPLDQPYWDGVAHLCRKVAEDYGFRPIDTPVIEQENLFKRSIGDVTDIIQKELFSFEDQGGERLALRPEFTASICRAYSERGMLNLPQPVKVYEYGTVYRHDRPQSGRYREFRQMDIETIGSDDSVTDAEIIIVCWVILKTLGIDVTIQMNSMGSVESRVEYKKILIDYYKRRKSDLCEECVNRMRKNPLRLLDCKEKECSELAKDAPPIIDHLDEDSKDHFMKVLEYLDEFDLPYMLNHSIVRGLDYYTKTTFEFWYGGEEKGKLVALGGGGRYDGLIETIGGRPTPSCGAALGIDRIVARIREGNPQSPQTKKFDVYLAQLGMLARKRALVLFEELRTKGFSVAQNFSKDGLRAQFELADKAGVKYTLVLGQKEIVDGTILLRDMESGMQETLNIQKVDKELRKRLDK
ncbi:MAG: Histidine-tRNA ligase [Parcubacteria group bacterium GW2011_GWA2_44_12]|nr:MAG: Histidine-tRNA ligase [Parcubacteria group bacterium GW2011_GWA2_44_12]